MIWCEEIDLVVWLTFSLFLPVFEFRVLARLLESLSLCVDASVRHSSGPSKGGSSKIQVYKVLKKIHYSF